MDMRSANVLHEGMFGRLRQLGDKLKKTQNAAEKLQITIKNTTKEIEKSKNERDEMLAVRRKFEKQTTCSIFVNVCSTSTRKTARYGISRGPSVRFAWKNTNTWPN